MFGLNPDNWKFDWNVAIDRIISIKTLSIPFIDNDVIDWQDYFSDMIGVTKPVDEEPKEIVFHFNQLTGKYMESKPIHETQKHKWIDDNILEVKISVIINYELERLILSYGESIKVISPQSSKEKLKLRIVESLIFY